MVTRQADITSVFDEAVQAHNAGDLTAAEQLYKETLSLQPDHCEANHNIGVVFASKNELEDALKFFKFALDTSPNVSLFWASYIDVLIKLDRITESKTLIKALTDAGISCDKIKDISHKLNVLHQEPGAQECDELDELINQKKFDDAQEKCLTLLETYPSSAVLNVHLGKCYFERGHIDHAISCYTKATQYQPKWEVGFAMLAQVNSSQGNLDQAIAAYETAISLKPDYAEAYNNMGIALQNIGKVEEAIEAYQRALSIDPKYADAYNNLGVALKKKDKLKEAIDSFRKAIKIKSNDADIHVNLGNSLKEVEELDTALDSFRQALVIKPNDADACQSMGNVLQMRGELEGAVNYYRQSMSIKPECVDVYLDYLTLLIQLSPADCLALSISNLNNEKRDALICSKPKFYVLNAINNYILGKFDESKANLNNFSKLCNSDQNGFYSMPDRHFCQAYFVFINTLLGQKISKPKITGKKIYHIGDSHCLSFAHNTMRIDNQPYQVMPYLTLGIKAHHLAKKLNNQFKAITKKNLRQIPHASNILISIGEIDCRINEGILKALRKTEEPLEELIIKTVNGYLQWFQDANIETGHKLYFLNVPAPVYNKSYSLELNHKVASVVSLFNKRLEVQLSCLNNYLIDLYEPTRGHQGFSNGLFHCDGYHLDNRILKNIENQLISLKT